MKSDRVVIKHVDFSKVGLAGPLSWWRSNEQVWTTCDQGHAASLDHEIAADGSVNPSVVCPEKECDFHEFVILEDWKNE
jgi:hypothetical protein